jgi:hypothetical protein
VSMGCDWPHGRNSSLSPHVGAWSLHALARDACMH